MRSLLVSPCLLLALIAGCNTSEAEVPTAAAESAAPEVEAPPTQAAVEAAAIADGDRTFGAPLVLADATPLADIARDPSHFSGQVVRTSGEIASVCQARGCWMEIREQGVAPVRVPMAGHSFFLPRDVAGRRATVEGTVSLRELPADERDHLAGEGALATAQPLEISATGVIIH